MDEFLSELSYDRRQDIRGCKLVNRLSQRDEDEGDLELVVGEVLDDVGVKAEHAELVSAHDSREKLHDEDLVLERVLLVCL